MTIISQGAESIIELIDGRVHKRRVAKSYRHPQLDAQLRSSRARREQKVLARCKELGIKVPQATLDETDFTLVMDHVPGRRLRDVLQESLDLRKLYRLGEWFAILHDNSIIHGDLTTSNVLVDEADQLWLIDFGLSFFSDKIEDKAVDIHLLEQALESTHHEHKDEFFTMFTEGYKHSQEYEAVIDRLAVVRSRGRHKH